MKRAVMWVAFSLALVAPASASAQDFRALEAGEPAPFSGILVPDDELVEWRREIERLRFEITLIEQRTTDLRAADLRLHAATIAACEEKLALRERLWSESAAELAGERDEARARQGPRWWQRGALWLPVGLAVGLTTGAAFVARR